MRQFLTLFIAIFFVCFGQVAFAKQSVHKVLVLPDDIQFDSTNYLVFPSASTMFATDVINEFHKSGLIKTISMNEVRDSLRKNTNLYVKTKSALKEFKYNYNISFVDLASIAKDFGADRVLIISSQTDVQNYFLRRTIWDFLNIPGATVVDPAYKLSTYVALVDVPRETIIWQDAFYKKISSRENRIIAQNFAPATEQLEKIKMYSMNTLSPRIALTVEAKLFPDLFLDKSTKGKVININDKKYTIPNIFKGKDADKTVVPELKPVTTQTPAASGSNADVNAKDKTSVKAKVKTSTKAKTKSKTKVQHKSKVNSVKTKPQKTTVNLIPIQSTDFKPMNVVPKRKYSNPYGAVINSL